MDQAELDTLISEQHRLRLRIIDQRERLALARKVGDRQTLENAVRLAGLRRAASL